jgi:hypothetical protein
LYEGCRVGNTGAAALASALERNISLRQLHVGRKIDDTGAAILAAALQKNTTLTELAFFCEFDSEHFF